MAELFIKVLNPQGYAKIDRYSYSKISTYEGCKFKFKLQYIDGNWVPSSSIATEFGTAMHEAEEDIAKAIQAGQPIDYVKIKNDFIIKNRKLEYKYASEYNVPDNKEGSFRTYKEKMNEYLDTYIYRLETFMKQHPTYKIAGIEQAFDFSYDEKHSFNGKIDRVFLDEATGKLIIQDIKSWAEPKKPAELKAPMQFAVYMMAAELLYGVNRSNITCEYDLPLCNISQPATSPTIIEECEPQIQKLFAGIAAGNFKPSPSALCNWCQYSPIANPDLLNSKPNAVCPYACTWRKKGDNVRDVLMRWQGPEMESCDRKLCIEQLKQLSK